MKFATRKTASLLVGLGLLVGCSAPMPPGAPAPTAVPSGAALPTPAPPNTIVADAVVVPNRYVDVSFSVGGSVAEVLVNEGDTVKAGAPLARLVTRDLELQVAQRKASLAQAQARYAQIEAGSTEAQIAAQQAVVRNAQAQLDRVRSGNITGADIAGAQAQLRAAQARLNALKNPSQADLSAAQLAVTQAQTNLESIRNGASATKTNAELAMRRAADELTRAQASYSTAKSNWDYVQETGADPTNPNTTDPATGKKKKNTLNDVQQRQYYEAFVQAEAAMRSAEKALAQAEVSYDQARQDEVTQNQQAAAAFANAQQQLGALKSPSANDLAQAQASVEQARANLQKLQQGGTKADIAAAQAGVEQAQANLAQLTTPARPVDLAEAQAGVEQARVALEQAEHDLARATLLAPFGGTIAERHLDIGQYVSSASMGAGGSAPFVLADFGKWKIETNNLNERDVVRLRVGQPAQITFDALPSVTLKGNVSAIQPRGADRYGDMIYTVTVTPDTWDARLRWNMSASVAIEAIAE